MVPVHLLLTLLLSIPSAQAAAVPAWKPVVTGSADGRFVAEIKKVPGQERVRDALARWRLTVFEASAGAVGAPLWHCFFPYDGSREHFLLSDDGTRFVHVATPFSRHRPVVRVWREGEELGSITGEALGVERDGVLQTKDGPRWIASGADAVRLAWRQSDQGPWLALELAGHDGVLRTVDLGTGEPFSVPPGPDVLHVHPGIEDDLLGKLQAPWVLSFEAPSHVLAGTPVEVLVSGNYPTPNWRLIGFELTYRDVEARTLELVPRTAPPDRDMQGQVLDAFQGAIVLQGLSAGRWTIQVRGREETALPPLVVEVLPARLRARLRVTGGIAGVSRRVNVFAPGLAELSAFEPETLSRSAFLPRERIHRIDSAFARLPEEPRSRTSPVATDVFVYDLGWWKDERWHEVRVDDVTAEGAVRALVEELRGLR